MLYRGQNAQCSLSSQRTGCSQHCMQQLDRISTTHMAQISEMQRALFHTLGCSSGICPWYASTRATGRAALAAPHLHSRGGAPDPAIVFIDQAPDPERAPRLVQVSMQVTDGDHARRRGQECGVRRCLLATKHQPVCTRVFRP